MLNIVSLRKPVILCMCCTYYIYKYFMINYIVILGYRWFPGSETKLLLATSYTQTLCKRGCGKSLHIHLYINFLIHRCFFLVFFFS
jgi:hypothetical protein